jgi:hypothetical protein
VDWNRWRGARQASHARDAGGLLFAAMMFTLSHAWIAIVRELAVSPRALLSYALQQAVGWALFLLVDDRLPQRASRFLWAAVGTLYTSFTVVDAMLMRMTSLPLREILPMLLASQQVIEGMREIGLTPARLLLLPALLLAAAAAGGTLRLYFDSLCARVRSARPGAAGSLAWLAILPFTFVAEQAASRDADEYLYRGFRMPGYVQLYSTSSKSIQVPLPPPVDHKQRAQWLTAMGPVENPRHVLYVLLESFRADVVKQAVCPTIWGLSQRGLSFDGALAEATYTPLSWSVLLFDETAHDNLFGRHPGRPEPLGSWLLAVMARAGYEPHVSVSTNLTYAKTRDRLLGRKPDELDFFQAAADVGDDPTNKNANDREATDHVVQFIRQHVWDERPQFMLLQLDSTHYTYPFPEDEAVFKPYSESLELPRPIENATEAALLRNRYLNAAHYVDAQLKRVIDALEQAGVYDDMVVVLTADHGEGLSPGLQGHGFVAEATKRVPIIFKFPGRAPGRSQQLISHRDILPRLTEYLGIAMPGVATRGSAFVDPTVTPAVFTLAPSGRYGQLTTPSYVVDLRLIWEPTSVTVTPAGTQLLAKGADPRSAPDPAEWLPLLTRFMADQAKSMPNMR